MDYIILLFSCIAEYLIFSDFFDAFLSIRPNFQPIWNRILIAIPFIGIYFGINTLQISYLNMISFICLLLLYSFLYEANFKERLLYIVFLCAIFFGCEFLFVVLLKQPSTLPLRKAIIPIMQSGSILQHPEAETDMAGRCGAVPETITTWNWWELRRQHLWLREWQP